MDMCLEEMMINIRVFHNFTTFELTSTFFSDGVLGADYEFDIIFSSRRHFDAPRALFRVFLISRILHIVEKQN